MDLHSPVRTSLAKHTRRTAAVIGGIALIAGSLSLPGLAAAAPADPADTVFLNGQVMQFTADGTGVSYAKALAVKDGRISFVGGNTEARQRIGDETTVYDLAGRTLMPGLGDGHFHGARQTDCEMAYEGGTEETILGKLKACLLSPEQLPYLKTNTRLSASNFMGDGVIPEGLMVDKHLLDRLSADPADDEFGTGTTRPIVISNMDAHKSYTNSQALINGGVTASTPPGSGWIGIGQDGQPNGMFADFRANWGPSTPRLPSYDMLVKNVERANSEGITMGMRALDGSAAQDALLADNGKLTLRLSQAADATGWVRGETDPAKLATRINSLNATKAQYDGYTSPNSPGQVIVNTVKIFCDGVPEYPGQTASMLKPYKKNIGTPENPILVDGDQSGEDPSCSDSVPGFTALDAAHWNVHLHSLGDRATREGLDSIEAAENANPGWDRRHTITHLQFVDPADIPRFKQLGVIANMSLQWAERNAWSTRGIEGYVDDALLPRLYPARELLDAGARLSAGSDWPVNDLSPWRQIETAVTRSGPVSESHAVYEGQLAPQEAITLNEAVRAGTLGVAYQIGLENETGSIETGKYADLIVTDQNIFTAPIENVSETKPIITMVGGKVVYEGTKTRLAKTIGCPYNFTCDGADANVSTLKDDSATVAYRGTQTVDVLGNDGRAGEPALEASTLTLLNGSSAVDSVSTATGTFTVTGGKVRFTAAKKASGTTTVRYRVGNAEESTSIATLKVTVGKAKPSLTASAKRGATGNAAVTVKLRLPDTATSTIRTSVKVYDGKKLVKAKLSVVKGKAVLRLKKLKKGAHTFTVVYAGNSLYANATAKSRVRVR